MTNIYGNITTQTKIESNSEVTNRCEYEFAPKKWEHDHPTSAKHDDGSIWKCPHEKQDDHEYCIFHLPENERSRDELNKAIVQTMDNAGSGEMLEIYGAVFREVDLQKWSEASASVDCSLRLRNCVFSGKISAMDAKFSFELDFSGSIIESGISCRECVFSEGIKIDCCLFLPDSHSVVFNKCRVHGPISMNNSVFLNRFHITDCKFFENMSIADATFCELATFQLNIFDCELFFLGTKFLSKATREDPCTTFYDSVFNYDLSFRSCEFRDSAQFNDIEVEGTAIFDDVESNGEINFQRSLLGAFSMRGVLLHDDINFSSAEVQTLKVTRIKTFSSPIRFKFIESTVKGGYLFGLGMGDYEADFAGATIGDIDLKRNFTTSLLNPFDDIERIVNEKEGNPLESIRFLETSFNGFRFVRYHSYLDEIDWNIHKINGKSPTIDALELLVDGKSRRTSRTIRIEGNVSDFDSLEHTYINAKRCASDQGDQRAVSKFYLKEMMYRQKRFKEKIFYSASRPISFNSIKEGLRSIIQWKINTFLKLSCGYGERLWLVLFYSIILIVGSAFLYPTMGGISNGEQIIQASKVNQGNIPFTYIPSNSVFVQSLYFSTVTFTTLGFGDYQPVGDGAKLLAGTEAFLGSFLIALLIFSLGRKMQR